MAAVRVGLGCCQPARWAAVWRRTLSIWSNETLCSGGSMTAARSGLTRASASVLTSMRQLSLSGHRPAAASVTFGGDSAVIESHEKDVKFVDHKSIVVRGGRGGNGCVAWYRNSARTRKFPEGADGGRGGDVILVADGGMSTLATVPPVMVGYAGKPGGSANMLGAAAPPRRMRVPVGTLIHRDGEVVADLTEPGQEFLAARGGAAGRGNTGGLERTRAQQPMDERAVGKPGEDIRYLFDLRTIADVGLVGLPNAGKSTFLNAVSNAHPRIADFPFTTLNPHCGVVDFPDYFRLRIADVPGLIAGASQNVGLGHRFLKHVERNRILVYIIDVSRPDCCEQFCIIRDELQAYNPALVERQTLVVANKMDQPASAANLERLALTVPEHIPIVPVAANRAQNVTTVTRLLRRMIETSGDERPAVFRTSPLIKAPEA
ncbi:uncharacterized protein MONBRDRAFT_33461 [Monosiga brevicollis MX1]|uniref:Obg family GTPase CgtA n=1 Tax=Monosiga brevicollis TaxID=81824 RepID=A9V5I4_MONBE|nr:uncharacterized protein MONBRDRAFT_33461 [Monosiga brevicollis MX1]EDQ87375.1 predicted protein [Monosiga brevicollis MX1]|eukprot:XP_001747988.1 hypothetical protein [Monosiga brevicollis MX1]